MPKSVRGVMREYKYGDLHAGSKTGPVVKNRRQAVAIALSEQRQQKTGHPHQNLGKYLHSKKSK